MMTHADGTDKFLIAVSLTMAIINGLGLPSFTFLYGNIINAFAETSEDMLDSVKTLAIELTIIGVGVWITSYGYFACSMILAERIGKKTRVAYLRSILS